MKKYLNGKYIELTEEEIEELQKQQENQSEPQPTQEEIIAKQQEQIDMLTQCSLEMSMKVYE